MSEPNRSVKPIKCLGKSSNQMGLYYHEDVRRIEKQRDEAIKALRGAGIIVSDLREKLRIEP